MLSGEHPPMSVFFLEGFFQTLKNVSFPFQGHRQVKAGHSVRHTPGENLTVDPFIEPHLKELTNAT